MCHRQLASDSSGSTHKSHLMSKAHKTIVKDLEHCLSQSELVDSSASRKRVREATSADAAQSSLMGFVTTKFSASEKKKASFMLFLFSYFYLKSLSSIYHVLSSLG